MLQNFEESLNEKQESPQQEKRSEVIQNAKQHPTEDNFDDILNLIKVDQPPKVKLKRYFWQLDDCYENIQQKKRSSNPVNFKDVLPRTFPNIIATAMNPNSPPMLRGKCLRLCLTEAVDHEFTKQLLTQTQDVSHSIPFNVLVDIIKRLTSSTQTELRLQTRKNLLIHIVNDRWKEIEPKEIVSIMYQLDELFDMKSVTKHFRALSQEKKTKQKQTSENSVEISSFEETANENSRVNEWIIQSVNLDRCILDIVDDLKSKDLARILTLTAKWNSRNQILISAIIHRLDSVVDFTDFNRIQVINLLSACSSLSIHSEPLLDRISEALVCESSGLTPSTTTSVLAYFSRLKWCNPGLISQCLEYAGHNISSFTGKEACSLLMSVSNLYTHSMIERHKHVIAGMAYVMFPFLFLLLFLFCFCSCFVCFCVF